jgi:hypothetical protein
MDAYSDDCLREIVPWRYKSLELGHDYHLLTREISTPADPQWFRSDYVPLAGGSDLPNLSLYVTTRVAVSDLTELVDVRELRGTQIELRASGIDDARGIVWNDGGLSYVLEARRKGQPADATDALLVRYVDAMLSAP